MGVALRIGIRNLLVLAVGALPLWFLLAWLTGSRSDGQSGSPWDAFAVGYIFVVGPLLIAGGLQQIILVLCVRANLRSRWLAMLTVAIIPLVVGLISAPLAVQYSTRFVLATVLSLMAAVATPSRAPR